MTTTVGLLAHPGIEILNFAGPYQVFATASSLAGGDEELFRLVTIGSSADPVTVGGGGCLLPDAAFAVHPPLACLIIPGGSLEVPTIERSLIDWLSSQVASVPIVASVCTGAFLLAATGCLAGLTVTTHCEFTHILRQHFPDLDVVENRRWVDTGRFVTSAGRSAGIDMALHLVERLASRELAVATARRLEL